MKTNMMRLSAVITQALCMAGAYNVFYPSDSFPDSLVFPTVILGMIVVSLGVVTPGNSTGNGILHRLWFLNALVDAGISVPIWHDRIWFESAYTGPALAYIYASMWTSIAMSAIEAVS